MEALNASKIFRNLLLLMLSDVKRNMTVLIMILLHNLFLCVKGARI